MDFVPYANAWMAAKYNLAKLNSDLSNSSPVIVPFQHSVWKSQKKVSLFENLKLVVKQCYQTGQF